MAEFRKIETQRQAPPDLSPEITREINLPPLTLEIRGLDPRRADAGLDAIVEAHTKDGRQYTFGAEYKRLWTPKVFETAVREAVAAAEQAGLLPMVILPYLSDDRLRELEAARVSGLDLCGNGVIIIPKDLLVYRTGAPNRFTTSAPIKNIYRGTSSLVARTFLLRPQYPSLSELQAEIERRGGRVSLPTVSKVVSGLEDDLIVGRNDSALRLLQPDKLLDRLTENYEQPEITQRNPYKVTSNSASFMQTKLRAAIIEAIPKVVESAPNLVYAATGIASARRYAAVPPEDAISLYFKSWPDIFSVIHFVIDEVKKNIGQQISFTPENRFPMFDFWIVREPTVYTFDPHPEEGIGFPWASPIQTYLEMMRDDERMRQTAAQVRERILAPLRESQQ